jgi:hypothetical protein
MSTGDTPRTPGLGDLFAKLRKSVGDGMRITMPAIVTRYDANKQCVDAQIVTMNEVAGEDGPVAERLAPVLNAPVMFYGSGGYRDTMPIEVGSVVTLFFTSVSLERWLSLGGEVEPRDASRYTHALAYPGGHSFAGSTSPSTSAPADARVFHGPAGGIFKFGGPSSSNVPLTLADANALKASIAAIPPTGNAFADAAVAAVKLAFADWHPSGSPRIKVP